MFVWSDRALFLGDRSVTDVHAHNAVELSVALDEAGIDMVSGSTRHEGIAGAVVRSDAEHQLSIHGPKIAIVYLDPRSPAAAGLHSWLGERSMAPLPAEVAAEHRAPLIGLFDRGAGLAQAGPLCKSLVRALAPDPPRPRADRRIRRALAVIADRLEDPPTQAELAAEVGLSPSRLGHIFTDQVGLPMRRYVLWMRLRHALTSALGGASMAEAAHAAGFSDAAHFTRTCRRMFGLPPTAFSPVDAVFVAADQFVQAPPSQRP